MNTRYYVNTSGDYLGGFVSTISADGIEWWPEIPLGAVEIPAPPPDGRMIMDMTSGEWASPPPVIPSSVTKRQLMLALLSMGLLDIVEGAIAASSDRELKINWEYGTDFERTHPLVASVAELLHKTSAEVDDLFRLAATL